MAHIKSEVNSIEMNRNVQQTASKVYGTLADPTEKEKQREKEIMKEKDP